jgi:hypothetical protein
MKYCVNLSRHWQVPCGREAEAGPGLSEATVAALQQLHQRPSGQWLCGATCHTRPHRTLPAGGSHRNGQYAVQIVRFCSHYSQPNFVIVKARDLQFLSIIQ